MDKSFEDKVNVILKNVGTILREKNSTYGNSALEPIRVFSQASTVEQLLVRIDDKLSRVRTGIVREDEDVLYDLLGYLILLKIKLNETT